MADDLPSPTAVRIDTAARMLDVSPWTIRLWIQSGRLPAAKIGRSWRIRVADLNAMLDPKTAVPA